MKLGLIADIHANIEALEAVLSRLEQERVDLILCAGDLVAYGAHPNLVIERIRSAGIPCVSGNYDDAVGWDKPSASRKSASPRNDALKQAALAWTRQTVDPDNKRFLKSLPWLLEYRFQGKKIVMLHGGLEHLDDWLVPGKALLEKVVGQLGADILILGHSHQVFCHQIGQTLVINPGAVGRSLDGDTRAACAILNVEKLKVKTLRVSYNLQKALEAIRQTDMPNEIATLLQHGARRIEEVL